MGDLTPMNGDQEFLAAIYNRLGEVLDRLPPKPPLTGEGGTVELREPVAASGNTEGEGERGRAESLRPRPAARPRKASPEPRSKSEPKKT